MISHHIKLKCIYVFMYICNFILFSDRECFKMKIWVVRRVSNFYLRWSYDHFPLEPPTYHPSLTLSPPHIGKPTPWELPNLRLWTSISEYTQIYRPRTKLENSFLWSTQTNTERNRRITNLNKVRRNKGFPKGIGHL